MAQISRIIVFFLAFVGTLFAQNTPQLQFQGFDGGFLTFGKQEKGFRAFEFRSEFDPWHIIVRGKVNAGPQTSDLDIMPDDIGVILSYFDVGFKDPSGKPQMVAVHELMIFVEDEPADVKDINIEFLPPTAGHAATAKLAEAGALFKAYVASMPEEPRISREDAAITKALADPWNKDRRIRLQTATAQKVEQARQDSIAAAQKLARKAERARQDSIANANRVMAAATTRVAQTNTDETQSSTALTRTSAYEDQTTTPVKKKKKHKKHKKKKKKRVVEDDEYSEDEDDGSVRHIDTGIDEDDQRSGEYTKYGWATAIGAVALLGYGVYQHIEFNDRLDKIQWVEANAPGFVSTPDASLEPTGLGVTSSYNDLQSEKTGFEQRRNIALALGAICVAGSIILFRF
ncbi:MAG TPA: hypothetical protein VLM37_04355 [Fibrobacteraceae bacterium]|nr:hypothetical protein [Fibrobacteraceae bacterium]